MVIALHLWHVSIRYVAQLYTGTTGFPFCVPTSWATFISADVLTTSVMSCRELTKVRRYRCLNRPKHQSGANFVWPTSMKKSVTSRCKPVITLQARYYKIELNVCGMLVSMCTFFSEVIGNV